MRNAFDLHIPRRRCSDHDDENQTENVFRRARFLLVAFSLRSRYHFFIFHFFIFVATTISL